MPASSHITTLFLDIGGVLGTNGWDTPARQRAADTFGLDFATFNDRHKRIFDQYEVGHLTLVEYLRGAVFYEKRSFSEADFRAFMLRQSEPWPENIAYFRELKARHGLKLYAVNNEGRELNEYRFRHFGLDSLFEAAVSSCYVGMRKPDPGIYRLAIDLSRAAPPQVLTIDDRPQFTELVPALGLQALRHETLDQTRAALATNFQLG